MHEFRLADSQTYPSAELSRSPTVSQRPMCILLRWDVTADAGKQQRRCAAWNRTTLQCNYNVVSWQSGAGDDNKTTTSMISCASVRSNLLLNISEWISVLDVINAMPSSDSRRRCCCNCRLPVSNLSLDCRNLFSNTFRRRHSQPRVSNMPLVLNIILATGKVDKFKKKYFTDGRSSKSTRTSTLPAAHLAYHYTTTPKCFWPFLQ